MEECPCVTNISQRKGQLSNANVSKQNSVIAYTPYKYRLEVDVTAAQLTLNSKSHFCAVLSPETWHNGRTIGIEESQNKINTRLTVYMKALMLKKRA
jgi:hypothetical protein